MTAERRGLRAIFARGSRSFSFAARLLPSRTRDDVAALYGWCRACDDAVDGVPRDEQPAALARLREDLDAVYGGRRPGLGPVLSAFQDLVTRTEIPRAYPEELLEGMAMDVADTRYPTVAALELYAFRVAGTVGLMMAHVLGVSHRDALGPAVDLGIGFQLTNICRDVAEDWALGRLYVPDELLVPEGLAGLTARLGQPLPPEAVPGLGRAVARLLAEAERRYRSADRGVAYLPVAGGLAVAAARHIYAEIGHELARRGHDVKAGRVVVPTRRKLELAGTAVVAALPALPARLLTGHRRVPLQQVFRFQPRSEAPS
jgi:15-cis-phytoene synthase